MNKKRIIIYGIILALVATVVLLVVLSAKEKNALSTNETLTQQLESYGEKFYEDYYFNQTQTIDGLELSSFVESGIPVTLTKMAELFVVVEADLIKTMVKGDKVCNFDNTKVVIYPEEPFNRTSYRLETFLDC